MRYNIDMEKSEKMKALKLWLIVIGILVLTVVVFGLTYYANSHVETWDGEDSDVSFQSGDASKYLVAPAENNGGIGDHVRGKSDSKVVFVEYADLQCPACASVISIVDGLTAEYGDRVAFVFRHFLITGHTNAKSAAKAAESAGKQGHFWDMIDALYTNRSAWVSLSGEELNEAYAKIFEGIAADGDVEAFRNQMTDANIQKKVEFDYKRGMNKDKVTATPSFYINDVAIDIDNVQSWADLENTLRAALDKALEDTASEE